jgi:hypothetical protein
MVGPFLFELKELLEEIAVDGSVYLLLERLLLMIAVAPFMKTIDHLIKDRGEQGGTWES